MFISYIGDEVSGIARARASLHSQGVANCLDGLTCSYSANGVEDLEVDCILPTICRITNADPSEVVLTPDINGAGTGDDDDDDDDDEPPPRTTEYWLVTIEDIWPLKVVERLSISLVLVHRPCGGSSGLFLRF